MRCRKRWRWRWRLDEVYVTINGVTRYLWQVVDHGDRPLAHKRAEIFDLPFQRRERAMLR